MRWTNPVLHQCQLDISRIAKYLEKRATSTLKLVLASRDLELGTILRERDVVLTDWPRAVPHDSATKTQDLVGRSYRK